MTGHRMVVRTSRRVLLGVTIFTAVCTALFSLPIHLMHEEKSPDLLAFFLMFYGTTGLMWVMLAEYTVFTGLGLKGDYLVIAKSFPLPVRRYIRLDQVKQIQRKKRRVSYYLKGRQAPIGDDDHYLVFTRFDRVYRSTSIYRERDDYRVETSPIWGEQSKRRIIDPKQKVTYWRIAWDAIALRILVAVVASLPYQPWRFFL